MRVGARRPSSTTAAGAGLVGGVTLPRARATGGGIGAVARRAGGASGGRTGLLTPCVRGAGGVGGVKSWRRVGIGVLPYVKRPTAIAVTPAPVVTRQPPFAAVTARSPSGTTYTPIAAVAARIGIDAPPEPSLIEHVLVADADTEMIRRSM